jgi:hypothetical protein
MNMSILIRLLTAIAICFAGAAGWAQYPILPAAPLPGGTAIYGELETEPYSNVSAPNSVPMQTIQQPNPLVLPPSPSLNQPCNPCQPVTLNPALKDIAALKPPQQYNPNGSASTSSPQWVSNPYRYQTKSTFDVPQSSPVNSGYSGVGIKYGPGGISLNKAAAERLALGLSIDAVAYREGKIIITGSKDSASKIDAALFLTSLRLACRSDDPFFSLDAVDGKAWQDQSQAALASIWSHVEATLTGNITESGFSVHTYSVSQDLPSRWAEIQSQYPELRTRLVFRPEWLRDTRFGEILYKADVLLKELSVGYPVVQPAGYLRATGISGYIAPEMRGAARNLLVPSKLLQRGWQGHRLWFDIMPQVVVGDEIADTDPDANIDRRSFPALYAALKVQGFVDEAHPYPTPTSSVYADGKITDLSEVFPKMFVRRHDSATGQDLPGRSNDLDLLSGDVNHRPALYANNYRELRELTEIFRAYIAAVSVVKDDAQICGNVGSTPLSDGEKVVERLPEFRPSDLFITVAAYASPDGSLRYATSNSVNGGISLRGKQFYPQAVVQQTTPIIRQIKLALVAGIPAASWSDSSGRQYIAFDTDPRESPARVPIVAAGPSK